MIQNIILTVPHSKEKKNKKNESERTFDLVALSFAKQLYSEIDLNKKELKISNIKLIKSYTNRINNFDDNRFSHSKSQKTIKADSLLWNELRSTILFYTNKLKFDYTSLLLFDCHSFPNTKESFGTPITDIVLLDNYPYQSLTSNLNTFFNKETKFSCKLLNALTGSNSILDMFTLHPFYIPTILIEINEKFLNDQLKLKYISESLVDFFLQMVKKK